MMINEQNANDSPCKALSTKAIDQVEFDVEWCILKIRSPCLFDIDILVPAIVSCIELQVVNLYKIILL